jgi:hypothetical protein
MNMATRQEQVDEYYYLGFDLTESQSDLVEFAIKRPAIVGMSVVTIGSIHGRVLNYTLYRTDANMTIISMFTRNRIRYLQQLRKYWPED